MKKKTYKIIINIFLFIILGLTIFSISYISFKKNIETSNCEKLSNPCSIYECKKDSNFIHKYNKDGINCIIYLEKFGMDLIKNE